MDLVDVTLANEDAYSKAIDNVEESIGDLISIAMIPHSLLSLSLTILTNRKVTSRTSRSLLATQKMKECTL